MSVHPEQRACHNLHGLRQLNPPVYEPDAHLAIGSAEVLDPQVLAFVMIGNMVQEVKAEPVSALPVEQATPNDFSGAVIDAAAYNTTGSGTPLYLGSPVCEV